VLRLNRGKDYAQPQKETLWSREHSYNLETGSGLFCDGTRRYGIACIKSVQKLAKERLFLWKMTKKGHKFGLKIGNVLGLYLKKII